MWYAVLYLSYSAHIQSLPKQFCWGESPPYSSPLDRYIATNCMHGHTKYLARVTRNLVFFDGDCTCLVRVLLRLSIRQGSHSLCSTLHGQVRSLVFCGSRTKIHQNPSSNNNRDQHSKKVQKYYVHSRGLPRSPSISPKINDGGVSHVFELENQKNLV